jgi:hypothetical protein
VWRNPIVGYIQGMNFLVFRLRKYLDEESAFWLFVLIVESYLPPDFYVEMYGATTHATILEKIFKQYNMLPGVIRTFEAQEFYLVNLSARLFLSLFCQSLPEETSIRVLDLIFLKGMSSNKIIFDVTLAYLRLLEKQIMNCTDQEEIQKVLNPNN